MPDNIILEIDDDELDRLAAILKPNEYFPEEFDRNALKRMFAGRYHCDLEAYYKLKECCDKKNMTDWYAWREENTECIYLQGADFHSMHCKCADLRNIHCEGANFMEAECERAMFEGAYCDGANFSSANCKKAFFIGTHRREADFICADCKSANFSNAHCEGANFLGAECNKTNFKDAYCNETILSDANCENANFHSAYCNGANFDETNCASAHFYSTTLDAKSSFLGCFFNRKTDFRLTNINNIKIEIGKKFFLERNMRQLNWEDWYRECCIFSPRKFVTKFFWWISDYGYSTIRIVLIYLIFITIFACLYKIFPGLLNANGDSPNSLYTLLFTLPGESSRNFSHLLCFAAATTVTLGLGFGDIQVHGYLPGMIVVLFNLLIGYFFLAVLVTRLSVLFQTMAPSYRPPRRWE